MTHFVDVVIADHEQQLALVLEDFHHLAFELSRSIDLLKIQFTVGSSLQSCHEIIATRPNGVLTVTIDDRGPINVRGMHDTPLRPVVIEDAFEIGYEYGTVVADCDVIVDIVRVVFCGRVVADLWKSLGGRCG